MKTSLIMALGSAGLLSSFLWLFGNNIIVLFSNDANIIKECSDIMHFLSPFYFTYCCVEIISGTMRGCGESFKPMLVVCLGICVLRIIWVIFVSPIYPTFKMVIISYPITWSITSILFIFFYQFFCKKNL